MPKLTPEQECVLRDLAAAGGSRVVPMDVFRGVVIALWTECYIRSAAVELGKLEIHLTEKGWALARQLMPVVKSD